MLVVESGSVQRSWHPFGEDILHCDQVLVDEFLQHFVLVVAIARGEAVIDHNGARAGDGRVDAVQLLLFRLHHWELL